MNKWLKFGLLILGITLVILWIQNARTKEPTIKANNFTTPTNQKLQRIKIGNSSPFKQFEDKFGVPQTGAPIMR